MAKKIKYFYLDQNLLQFQEIKFYWNFRCVIKLKDMFFRSENSNLFFGKLSNKQIKIDSQLK